MLQTALPAAESGQAPQSRNDTATHRRIFVWLNLLCLDAPLVAVVWLAMFASTFGLRIPIESRITLFLTAWLIYLGDRLGDVLTVESCDALSGRQAFCSRHRPAFLVAIVVIALGDGRLILSALDFRLRFAGAIIGIIAAAYLIVNHSLGQLWRIIPLKELFIGFLFAAGTVIPVATKMTATTPVFYVTTILFACLCTFNCVSIAAWDQALDEEQGKYSIATRFDALRDTLQPLGLSLAAAAGICSIAFRAAAPAINCIALSCVFLVLLDVTKNRIPRDERTALADLVLLTPIAFLIARSL